MMVLPFRPFVPMVFLFSMGCSSLSEGQSESSGHPHFRYSEAFYYQWAPGTPGPVGTNYIFKFIPRSGNKPEFQKVKIKDEAEKPDISTKGDTIILMVQKSGRKREAFKGKGAEKETKEKEAGKAAEQAIVRYTLNDEPHRFKVDEIPREKKTTLFE